MNHKAAELNNERLHNDAIEQEIYAILCQDGPLTNGAVAQRMGMTPWKRRPHLDAMKGRGEIRYKIIGGRYSV